jgi:hypothetical protein
VKQRAEILCLEATSVAIEHVLWAASSKISARELLRSAGIDWPEALEATWHDAVLGLACRWRRLQATPAQIISLRRVA